MRYHVLVLAAGAALLGPSVAIADDQSELAAAKAAHAATVARLDDTLAQAQRTHRAGVEAAHRQLLDAYANAILKAQDAGDDVAVRRLREAKRRLQQLVPRDLATVAGAELFECVLGSYGQAIRGPRCRFVNLRPPNRNLWTPEIRAAVAGKVSFESIDYIGTAKLVVTEPGWYSIDLPGEGTQLRLNGLLLAGNDVQLSRGVYDVEIYTNVWGGPYMQYASGAIRPRGSDKPLPLVNTAADVNAFLAKQIDGRKVVETSGYRPPAVDVSIRLPKGTVVQPAVPEFLLIER